MQKIIFMGLTYIFAGLIGYWVSSFYYSRSAEEAAKVVMDSNHANNGSNAYYELYFQLELIKIAARNDDTKIDSADLLKYLCIGASRWLQVAEPYAEWFMRNPQYEAAIERSRLKILEDARQLLSSPQAGGKCPKSTGVN